MKLPVIKHIQDFIENHDQDYVQEAIELLEHISNYRSIKDEELDVIGELISNMYGAIEVNQEIKKGTDKKIALNNFMKRVVNSIDN